MFSDLRTSIEADLTAASIKALSYIGEVITPPCAVVVPGEPYIQGPGEGRAIPFRKVEVAVDVLLLVPREGGAKAVAARIDQLIASAYGALKQNHRVQTASRPGVVTVSGSKYVGSVLSIEALTEEP